MDEAALITAAQGGEIDAYNALVLHFQTSAFNVAYRIMGDPDSAADATQEAFISAYRALDRFRGGSFKAWLMRIVTNACYDELRRRKRRPQATLEALHVEQEADTGKYASKPEDPEWRAEQMDLQAALLGCLQELPDEMRTISILRDVEGYSYDEIAEVMAVKVGTVKSRLSRSRASLRECLQDFGELLPASYRHIDNDN